MAQPSHLEQRLVALLNPSLNRLAATPWAVIVVAGVAIALTLPLAAVRSERDAVNVVESQPSSPAPAAVVSQPESPRTESPELESRPVNKAPIRQPEPNVVKSDLPAVSATSKLETPAVATTALNVTAEPVPAASPAPTAPPTPPATPPFECKVTSSMEMMKTASIEKIALGNGPWLINADRTIWAADQPYVANRSVNTVWMRPANTELKITARRLDGDAPELSVGPAAPYSTGYIAIGVVFPSAGCWEVTGTAGDSKLTFITKVRE